MRRTLSLLATTALILNATATGATPFINEFHYDNAGTDTGEFIELAGGVGWNLTGWSLALYNGNPTQRVTYGTTALSGTFANQSNGWGFLAFDYPENGIQNGIFGNGNGEPDGIALVRPDNTVAQFLSYEGSFTAANGPANGRTSRDIGVREAGTEAPGQSLRLTGVQTAGTLANETQPNGFTWASPAAATKGALNTGQVFTQTPPPPPPVGVNDRTIAEIQGAAQSSPLSGQSVRTTGIVTQVESNGYYLLSDTPDASNDTSEGIFVFVGNAAKPAVGDLVRLQGNVSEFLPGGNTDNLTTTQLSGISNLTVISVGNAFTPTIIGAGGRTPPVNLIETDPATPYQPSVAGRDFYESLEGMIVTVQNAVATAPTIEFTNGNREIYVRSDAPTTGLNSRGGLTISAGDFNPERIQIDQRGNTGVAVNTGAQLGNVTGAVGYDFGNFQIVTPGAPTFTANDPVREVSDLTVGGDRLRIATYNVENLQNGETTRYADLAQQVIRRLNSPEVIALQEIVTVGDNGQPQNPLTTLQGLVAAITAAGGPTYSIGVRGAEGVNDDRIVNAYLYDTSRVSLVGEIEYAPGSTTDAAFNDSRAPLVGTFRFNGQDVVVLNNHFSSRGGSDPLFGTVQPPINGSEDRRQLQGEFINAYVDALLGSNPDAKIAVVGDLNSFYFENPQLALQGLPGTQVLFGLHEQLAINERFNYNFDGNAQMLDYIYASMGLSSGALFDVVRFNSDFFDQFSDHDPLIASFLIEQVPAPAALALFGLGVVGVAIARRRRAVAG